MSKQTFYPSNPKVGEIFAVNGKGWVSYLIKLISRGVSHVEILALNPESGEIECFSADGKGARFKPMKDVVKDTDGDITYLELRDDVREKFDEQKFGEVIISLDGVPYDFLHLIGVGIDDEHINFFSIFSRIPTWILTMLKGVFHNEETLAKVVCSGASAWGLKKGLGLNINASEQTPLDICRWNLYKPKVKLLKGNPMTISKFNTVEVIGE